MVCRSFVPLRTSARIRFSGIPHNPKPPIMRGAPSNTSRTASSALATTLFIAKRILNEFHDVGTDERLGITRQADFHPRERRRWQRHGSEHYGSIREEKNTPR